ncbi:hypothetical protein CC77DRAFT_1054031 [Alternaria alternata]|uniref:Uncharacterized protein n=2 Tax=Alternaria alternata complex TaxID=187734 RepID=A0A177D7G8_ALTAL|nr:hypothetical protein CC77DRAFT_1054031 [Alternaria alternata]OAG15486.1 hypothetical protein CC77DRAFT_1054031 [Alternaria alternata]
MSTSGSLTVEQWYTGDINTGGQNNWRVTALAISATPVAYATFQNEYFYFTELANGYPSDMYTAGDPATTSGSVVVSMRSVPIPQFVYGTLDITVSSSAAEISSATSTLQSASQPDIFSATSSAAAEPSTTPIETSTVPATGASDPSLSGGAIAGIVIGGLFLTALIIGGWYFWRRRKRVKTVSSSSGGEIIAEKGGDGDILEMHADETLQELSARDRSDARELDPTQYSRYAPNGAHELMSHHGESRFRPAHELDPETRPGELPNGETEQAPQVQVYQHNLEPAVATTETTAAASSNVEAQRRREMEWLEMEEERMRKRREMLAIQADHKTQ